MKKLLLTTLVLVGLLVSGAPASADVYTIADQNSTARIDTGNTAPAGMVDWVVDGVNYLYQQWFWYRVNTPGADAQHQLQALPLIGTRLSDTDFDPGDDTITMAFGSRTGLEIEVAFALSGGNAGSNASDIREIINLHNHGDSDLSLSFFQYSDFDLSSNFIDTVSLVNGNTVRQTGTGLALSETVVTPAATRAELALFSSTRTALNTVADYNLNNITDAVTGDATWAFQWDVTLGHNGTMQISKDKNIRPIPEPGSMLLLGTGLFGLAGAVRRRLKK